MLQRCFAIAFRVHPPLIDLDFTLETLFNIYHEQCAERKSPAIQPGSAATIGVRRSQVESFAVISNHFQHESIDSSLSRSTSTLSLASDQQDYADSITTGD
jgi:hypothetical protein